MENKINLVSRKYLKLKPKEQQLETIASYVNGQDTVLVAPTGFGKSLIYQIAPFMYDEERYASNNTSRSIGNTSFTTTTENSSDKMDSSSGRSSSKGSLEGEEALAATSTPIRPIPEAEGRMMMEGAGGGKDDNYDLSSHFSDLNVMPISANYMAKTVTAKVS